MSFLEVYFNSSLQETIEIGDQPVSIGRAGHNQVQIDNKGVSLMHAVITKKDKAWFVEDLNSTNGTYLNGLKLEGRRPLQYGDTLVICKHDLKFVGVRSQAAYAKTTAQDDDADRTLLVHNVRAGQAPQPETGGKRRDSALLVYGELRNINKMLLSKPVYTIGKGRDNDLRVGGWFTPKLAAEIVRLGDSYYLSPFCKRQVKVNGREAVSRVKLSNDDNITIKKLTMKFVEE